MKVAEVNLSFPFSRRTQSGWTALIRTAPPGIPASSCRGIHQLVLRRAHEPLEVRVQVVVVLQVDSIPALKSFNHQFSVRERRNFDRLGPATPVDVYPSARNRCHSRERKGMQRYAIELQTETSCRLLRNAEIPKPWYCGTALEFGKPGENVTFPAAETWIGPAALSPKDETRRRRIIGTFVCFSYLNSRRYCHQRHSRPHFSRCASMDVNSENPLTTA